MAGNGPPPKDPNKRARSNKDVIPMRILPAILASQPNLPEFDVAKEQTDPDTGETVIVYEPYQWATITREWWQMWADSALATEFTSTDWSELRDTALLHSEFWHGKISLASELRLRTAKFGATPEDRARLRITFAQADEAEGVKPKRLSSRSRFEGMTVSDELEA